MPNPLLTPPGSTPTPVRRPQVTPSRGRRELIATLVPVGGGVLALVLLARWGMLIPGFGGLYSADAWGAWLLFGLAATACLLHRPFSSSTLGVAALVVPPVLVELGGVPAALMVAASALSADLVRRRLRRHSPFVGPERRRLVRSLESTGTLVLAVLAGALLGALLRPEPVAGALEALIVRQLVIAGVVYALALTALRLLDKKIRRPYQELPWVATMRPLLFDLPAWGAGIALAVVAARLGWGVAGPLLAAVALLALEIARQTLRHGISEQRIDDLERLTRASRRIAGDGRERGMVSVAERIRIECSNVIAFQWFQFELLAQGSDYLSWWAGPERHLTEGRAQPPVVPPPLPGIHKRSSWSRIERALETEDQLIGRFTLWCDPRQLASDSVEMLDALLPQMAASLQSALLDQEAKQDPLTGLAVRRVLEDRLLKGHRRCLREGLSMAVIMCDLDHFKRVNDTHGHAAGDRALVATAELLAEAVGDEQLAARYGGEEFTLLLEDCDRVEALKIAEHIRQRVEKLDLTIDDQPLPLTLSLGVAVFPDLHVKRAGELVELADEALYEAKKHGRNRALLNIGRGRYRTVAGGTVRGESVSAPAEPPQLFA